MSLAITTYTPAGGGNVLYKALSHPLAAQAAQALVAKLKAYQRVVLYDPLDIASQVESLLPLSQCPIDQIYTQQAALVGATRLQHQLLPVTDLAQSGAQALVLLAFDAERLQAQIAHLIPPDMALFSLDRVRLPNAWISDSKSYLSRLNFVTNFAFFRHQDGWRTRLTTANYWSGYGAKAPRLHGILFDQNGSELLRFEQALGPKGAPVVVDSAALAQRYRLPEFTGQLFMHVVGAAGHDVVKYALDSFSEDGTHWSATHDANAWPAQRYAGLPMPRAGERVCLWVQNPHAITIPAGALRIRALGGEEGTPIQQAVAPFATVAVDLGAALPACHASQVELIAGQYLVRPRYEIEDRGLRIAHVNVVREDLQADSHYRRCRPQLGRGYLLPAPLLPTTLYQTELLVTPMSPAQQRLALSLRMLDYGGELCYQHSLGLCAPADHRWVDVSALVELADGGHLELAYDDGAEGQVDGWFHAIFRYRHRASGYASETSFGCHMFNSVLTYGNEPQSYSGPPPGLSTRLYLRLGEPQASTTCHLIYPSSTHWHTHSDTRCSLVGEQGRVLAEVPLSIPLGGSSRIPMNACFEPETIAAAGVGGYVVVRDSTCRLFGYHMLAHGDGGFSLDHMFGF